MKNSTMLLLPKWFLMLDKLKLNHHMLPQDVLTWWNSTYDMLIFVLKYQEVLNIIAGNHNTKLHQYEMDNGGMGHFSAAVWSVKGKFSLYLPIPIDITTWHVFLLGFQGHNPIFFMCNGTLNIATVIPAMDHIDEVLAISAFDSKYSISVQAALTMGKKMLNWYYGKTDQLEVYRIAMSKY